MLKLSERVIRAIEPLCQHCCNIKYRNRIFREKHSRVGYVKLRSFQCSHVRSVRLIKQDREFTKDRAWVCHRTNLCVLFHDCDIALLEDSSRPVVEPSTITVSPGW